MNLLLSILWFMFPAAVANGIPPFFSILLPHLDWPMDFGIKVRGKRLFGSHKTIRGLIAGVLFSGGVFLLQQYSYIEAESIREVSLWNYNELPWHFGFALGFGALMGDAIKSFFKRQVGIGSGKTWFPWDQVDWVIGTLIISSLYVDLGLVEVGLFTLIGLVGHLISKVIGYFLRINKTMI